MKTTKELETVEVSGVKFDVHFTYHQDYGFEIEAIEDITGTQDLKEYLDNWVLETIENKIHSLYERRGWV